MFSINYKLYADDYESLGAFANTPPPPNEINRVFNLRIRDNKGNVRVRRRNFS